MPMYIHHIYIYTHTACLYNMHVYVPCNKATSYIYISRYIHIYSVYRGSLSIPIYYIYAYIYMYVHI